MINTILSQHIDDVFKEVLKIREYLHQHPELSFKEFETSKYIKSKLNDWGIAFSEIATTGIVGVIEPSNNTHHCIGLRADIDALPITEENNTNYCSVNKGVMHACGHDVHSAMLLGALKIIKQHQEKLNCKVKFIFQPGEEKLPGGASIMIKEGVLENPKVDEMYALHVFPELEAGKVGLKSGMYMASCDEIYISVNGKGGHGAMPHQNIDPILTSAHIITSLQSVISRNCPPNIPAVLSFGKIEGLGATNVIPNKVKLEGTFRTMNETWRTKAHHLIKKQTTFIANGFGANANINIIKGYPFLKNDIELTEKTRTILKQNLGKNNVIDLPIRMTGEDFAFFAQKIPTTFIRIGVKNESKNIVYPVHHSKFDIDPLALKIGLKTILSVVFY
ncbi:MAG TPA: amidohydrolase [Crocinitomix sp.]|nr:amidohydrolase [Crocinitomix sp.]